MHVINAMRVIAFIVLCALSRPPIGVEPGSITYYSSQIVFKDVFRQSMPWRPVLEGQVLHCDEHGWVSALQPGESAYSLMFADVAGHYPSGVYTCVYDGEGELVFSLGGRNLTQRPGRIMVAVNPANGPIHVRLASTNPSNYVRNVRLLLPGCDESSLTQQPFNPRFLELLDDFDVIRFESLMHSGSLVHQRWQDRVTPADETQAGPGGMALEYAIQLCNATDADPWFTMPPRADTEYVRHFAEMVRAGLNTDRTVAWSLDELVEHVAAEVREPIAEDDRALMRAARRQGLEVASFYMTPMLFAKPAIADTDSNLFRRLVVRMQNAHRHPRMEQIYLDHLRRWYAAGGGMWINHGLVHMPSRWGTYGLLEHMQESADSSPKFRAVRAAMQGAALPHALPARSDHDAKAADPVMGLVSPMVARIDFDGYFPDQDLYVAYAQGTAPVHSVWWTPPFLDGREQQQYYRVHITKNPAVWTRYVTSMIPATNGKIQISLQAVSCKRYDTAPYTADGTWPIWCHYDALACTGATLLNGDFENLDDTGQPLGWWHYGRTRGLARLVRDLAQAASGTNHVLCNTGSGYHAMLNDVRTGREVSLTWWARAHVPEHDFQGRISFDGIIATNQINMTGTNASPGTVLWDTDTCRPEWGHEEWLRWEKRLARKGWLMQCTDSWRTVEVTFVPDNDGEIELTLHGARIVDYGTMMLEPCCVCYDDVKVDGAELANGDFETLAGGMPVGWQRVGRDRQHELVQTETGSNGTNHYVDAWYEAGLRTRLRGVAANRPVTVRVRVKNE